MPLKLTHTPGEWEGTFGIALHALVDDLLSDGPKEDVTVTYADITNAKATATGTVEKIDEDGNLILIQIPMPSAIPMLDIIEIEVA